MTVFPGSSNSETIDIRSAPNPSPAGFHTVYAYGGSDTVYGSAYNDFIWGDTGNDTLYGFNGSDNLVGEAGNDNLYGGTGNDYLYGGAGNDLMQGGTGNDLLLGGQNDDTYVWQAGDGLDTINEDLSSGGSSGYGGGNDTIRISISASNLQILSDSTTNHLYITSAADFADGVVDEGIVIENFYLGGDYVVERLITSDGLVADLTLLFG